MISSEGRGFGLPKLPSTTKQPVFSGRLDFQIVRDEGEALPSPCSDAKDFWPLDLCLPSTSLLGCPRAGADLRSDKNISPAVFQVVAIGCHTRMGSCRRVKSVPAGYRETSPVILRRPNANFLTQYHTSHWRGTAKCRCRVYTNWM